MKKILIVEDVQYNLDLLVQLLEDNYQLVSAADGRIGFKLASSECPDLILMDMSLPIKDGWTAARELKADPNLKQIPIIGLSAHAMQGDRQKALENGCDAYLTKPIDEGLLLGMIETILEQAPIND